MRNRLALILCLICLFLGGFALAEPLTKEQLSHKTARIAVVQITGHWVWRAHGESPETLKEVLPYIDRAGQDGADLVVFPELLLGEFRVPCETTEKISAAAKKNNIYVIGGCFEIRDEKGNFSNSMLIFDRQGEIIGRYFKMHPAVGEPPSLYPPLPSDAEYLMQAGTELPVFDLDFGRIGILTCYDGYFPEPFRILSLKGTEIIVWPNARGGSVEKHIVLTNLQQNSVHMVTCNKAVGAGSMIAAWPNEILAICEEPKEDYILADLPMDRLRLDRKYARHFQQRKPECYQGILGHYDIKADYANLENPENFPMDPVRLEPAGFALTLNPHWLDKPLAIEMPTALRLGEQEILPEEKGPAFCPVWEQDPITLQRRFLFETPEGVSFGAVVTPSRQYAILEMVIRNTGNKALENIQPLVKVYLPEMARFSPLQKADWDEKVLLATGEEANRLLALAWEKGEAAQNDPDFVTIETPAIARLEPGSQSLWFGRLYFRMDQDIEALKKDVEQQRREWQFERQLRDAENKRRHPGQ